LENFRDINNNVIKKLINNNDDSYEFAKIGGFGFVPPDKKIRLEYIDLCEKYSGKFMFIKTPVYNKEDPRILSWIDIKKKFKYIIDLPGHSYSTKLYTLLYCKRLIFLIEGERPCMFKWEYKLKPYIHYIPVKSDFSNLLDLFNWAENHPNKVKKIINNAFQFGMNEVHPNILRKQFIDEIFILKNIEEIEGRKDLEERKDLKGGKDLEG